MGMLLMFAFYKTDTWYLLIKVMSTGTILYSSEFPKQLMLTGLHSLS